MNECELPNEISAIKTLCGMRDAPRAVLLEKNLRADHFADPRTREMFSVCMAMAKKRSEMPTYALLGQAPQLSADARELLVKTNKAYPPSRNRGDAEQIFEVLERLRQGRVILAAHREVMDSLDPEDADPADAFVIMEKALLNARNFGDEQTLRVGLDSNIMDAVSRSLNRTEPNTIPTGFIEFDERAGGLPRGGLTTLAASTGGGKSCMAMQIAINAVRRHFNVGFVSLEMQEAQTTNRLMSNVAGVSHTDIHRSTMNAMQKKRCIEAMKIWDEECEKAGKRLHVYHKPDTTISEIALQLRAFDFDLIIVDYINLLNKGDIDESNDALALKEMSRLAKIQAGTSNAAWLILAQLNAEGDVKYSKGIKENSDYLLSWTYGEAERESHIVEITQQKSRNSESFKFNLRENFKIQKFENIGSATENRDLRGIRKKKTQRHPTAKPMPGLNFDDEDDDD